MKIHYTNILLFPLKLNILVNTHKKPHTTARHTQKIPTTRSLSECELYAPVNYYSDPQMKEVMDNFNKQTQQRFHEYDDRMKTTRQKCKDKCDKEIQKIILKDKLEKQMAQQFSTLHTDIQSDAIPTCVCEKSLADKVEKGCLRCGSILGAAMPEVASIGATALYTLCQWQTKAIAAATEYALAKGAAQGAIAGIQAGKGVAIKSLKELGVQQFWPTMSSEILKMYHYKEVADLTAVIYKHKYEVCEKVTYDMFENMCEQFDIKIGVYTADGNYADLPKDAVPNALNEIVSNAETTAKAVAETERTRIAAEITQQQTAVINATYTSWQIAITASVIAIVVIVLIMVIIYLVLRYRRKKKMKKKLQYIKLLEE
ncbi:rifin [Plasmodium falciparum IGH-CR14]|uniref:Rifin n=1 Tax=Plasmodium falciparum IGH-CR14 TaxID=580059 RepID=A0A0L1I5K2_PLAFA|nr:rifin [Plasmodium falciparum IGH-CR14]